MYMPKRSEVESGPKPGRFDGMCQAAYEVCLVLALATVLLTVLHSFTTHHANIDEEPDAMHIGATVDDPGDFRIGESYPIYRLQETMRQPIGRAVAEHVDGSHVTFRYDPQSLISPMGRHGRILSGDAQRCLVNLGSQQGFAVGQYLNLLDGRTFLGNVRLTQVGPTESSAQLAAFVTPSVTSFGWIQALGLAPKDVVPLTDMKDKTVSEFQVATQVATENRGLGAFDLLCYAAMLGLYAVLFWRHRRSPFMVLLPRMVDKIRPSSGVRFAGLVVVGLPLAWLSAFFAVRSVEQLAWFVCTELLHVGVPQYFGYDKLQVLILPLFGLLLVAYEAFLWTKRTSPFTFIGRWIAFKGGIFGHTANDLPEHITMFFLQLIIVYAFARTIGGFLLGNLNDGIAASWPDARKAILPPTSGVSLDGIWRSLQSVGFALTHAPHPINEDAMFATWDDFIYNACILGCLLGYGYSLVGYVWGKFVRNVDFTVVGWLTNAWCYGPLFGVVIWRILPPLVGGDPAVTPGLFRTATFAVVLVLNVFYTLSIWNLGTMFGVMTDKGVRRTGFYSVVRHPNYTLESTMFMLISSRELSSILQWIAVGGYFMVYWLRSEREDQFMGASNPEYLEYRKQVRYKFIPGLY